jgi:hypothetical protein
VTDPMGRGEARRHPAWGPVVAAIASDKRLSNGLAAFMNWCATNEIAPEAVTDEGVQRFLHWLETRTLHPRPRDLVCRVPRLWNEAGARIPSWPQISLTRLSFRPPRRRLGWEDFSDSFRKDAEAYLRMRAELDVFDEALARPRRPLAPATLRLQSENLRLAASVLVETGVAVAEITSLADLVQPERFKAILRYYHRQADGEPNAFAIVLAKTMARLGVRNGYAYGLGGRSGQAARNASAEKPVW